MEYIVNIHIWCMHNCTQIATAYNHDQVNILDKLEPTLKWRLHDIILKEAT